MSSVLKKIRSSNKRTQISGKPQKLCREATLQLLCKNQSEFTHAGNKDDYDICRLPEELDSGEVLVHDRRDPLYRFDVASKGNLQEFERLHKADNTRLELQDNKGTAPIHKAAENGRVNIMQYIVDNGGNLNLLDKKGNTPLHCAVISGNTASIDFLLQNGADSSILNANHFAPLHLAVDINAVKSLQALLSNSNVDPNLPGEKGIRALHYCAYKDRDECATYLLQHGAKPCIKCDNGLFPINVAGKCASALTLEILIKHVEALGYKREDVLSFSDKENNMPLHCAVNSGDLKAVQVCLNAGAPVDARQEDSSTPLHFACAQGSVDMVRLMHDMQPEKFEVALNSVDVLKMTPLHRAALFDHVTVVEYLLKQTANINAQDAHDRSPLLLASSKGGWRSVQCLLENGADITLRDKNSRNFLHVAIKLGGHIDDFGCTVLKGLKELLNAGDDEGCTPLHYASKEGHLGAIDDLLKLGATINPKDNDKKSPLHFAARYGRYNTCKRLLDSHMGPNIINETDGDGLTALHIAAQNGNTKIITLLMQKGAYVTKDNTDNSPLHLAAENGYTRSMKLLLTVYPNLLDCVNKQGNSALHVSAQAGHTSAVELLMGLGGKFLYNKEDKTFFDIAIEKKNSDVAFAIVHNQRWDEAMELCSPLFSTPMNGLVQNLPDVCMAALDRCKTYNTYDKKCKDYTISYNFKYLQCPLRYQSEKRAAGEKYLPMLALNTMVRFGRVQCLSHPVSEHFLNMKWRAYGSWFHISNLVIYGMFVGFLTFMVTSCNYHFNTNYNSSASSNSSSYKKIERCDMDMGHKFSAFCVMVFCGISIIKEIVQIIQQRMKYFTEMTNLSEWVLYVTTLIYITPYISEFSLDIQLEAGAVAVFLAWFNCLLFLQRFDIFGIYVVMFLEILKTLLQVLSVFSILLIAFGMSFYMLMNKEESRAFESPGLSMLRTAMMMLELDYMASFNDPYTDDNPDTLYFGKTTILLLVVFVLLMPILLMNLLIGLAVGDISSVQQNATLKRIAMQVELHTDLERKLPMKILTMVDKPEYKVYPNKCAGYIHRVWSKMSFGQDSDDGWNNPAMSQQNHLYEEMYKQKMRLKNISSNMNKQYDLLRLIVQKMEIHTEDDNRDEGFASDAPENIKPSSRWTPAVRHNLVRQSAVVSAWKSVDHRPT